MDETKAVTILKALADGVHPSTGEIFPADSPYQSGEIVRALYCALAALDKGRTARTQRRSDLPGNAGKPWTADEDRKLLAAFDSAKSVEEIAKAHARTTAGIRARLEKHGRIKPPSSSWGTREQAGAAGRSAGS